MSTETPLKQNSKELTINVSERDVDDLRTRLQAQLRYYYSRRLFVHDVTFEPEIDHLSVTVGITYPQDVTGSRGGENVLKMVNIGNVKTFTAESIGEDYFKIELPSRTDLHSAYQQRHKEMLNELDWSMAKAIYSRVYELNPVRNQLNSLIEIVNWVRRKENLTVDQISNEQTSKNSEKYISVLKELGFLKVEDGVVSHGRKIDSADLKELSRKQYEKHVIGEIVNDGYYTLREDLGLGMLSHFPKYANAYYISAIRRGTTDLWLSVDDLRENLRVEYGREEGRLKVEDKLRQLDKVGVIDYENGEVSGHSNIFRQIKKDSPSFA